MYQYSDGILSETNCDFSESMDYANQTMQKLLSIDIPESFKELMMNKLFMNEDVFTACLIEYYKFLVLRSKNEKSQPSFLIDQIWREHFTSTKHYRDTCDNVFGRKVFIKYMNPKLIKSQFSEQYTDTMELYQNIFGHYPNYQIWKSVEDEIDILETPMYNINIFNMVNYYNSIKHVVTNAKIDLPLSSETDKWPEEEIQKAMEDIIYGKKLIIQRD